MDYDRTQMDDLLSRSAPRVGALNEEIEDELARMSVLSRATHQKRSNSRKRLSRSAAVTLSAALILSGAGAAAAATLTGWPYWKQEPLAPFTFTLPSGAECEMRFVGSVQGPYPEASEAALRYLRSVDLFAELDVEAQIDELRSTGQNQPRAGEIATLGSHPTLFNEDTTFSSDWEYQTAVVNAVIPAVVAELMQQGYEVEEDQFSWSSKLECPDAAW